MDTAYLSQLEQRYSLPAGYLKGMAGIESNYGTNVGDANGTYRGTFQLGPGVRSKFGGGAGNFYEDADSAAKYAAENTGILSKALGRAPTGSELYLAHQQGGGGAVSLLGNPNAPAGTLTDPKNISANNGDPNAPAFNFIKKYNDNYNKFAYGTPDGGGMSTPPPNINMGTQASPAGNVETPTFAGPSFASVPVQPTVPSTVASAAPQLPMSAPQGISGGVAPPTAAPQANPLDQIASALKPQQQTTQQQDPVAQVAMQENNTAMQRQQFIKANAQQLMASLAAGAQRGLV